MTKYFCVVGRLSVSGEDVVRELLLSFLVLKANQESRQAKDTEETRLGRLELRQCNVSVAVAVTVAKCSATTRHLEGNGSWMMDTAVGSVLMLSS